MVDMTQREIAEPPGIEGLHVPQDDGEDNKFITGGRQLLIDCSGILMMITKVKMVVDQKVMIIIKIRYLETN